MILSRRYSPKVNRIRISVIWNGRIPKYATMNICWPKVEKANAKIPPSPAPAICTTAIVSSMEAIA